MKSNRCGFVKTLAAGVTINPEWLNKAKREIGERSWNSPSAASAGGQNS